MTDPLPEWALQPRDVRLTVRLTRREHLHLEQLAKKSSADVESYVATILGMFLHGDIVAIDRFADEEPPELD